MSGGILEQLARAIVIVFLFYLGVVLREYQNSLIRPSSEQKVVE